jgi:spore coat protein CotF
MKTTKPLPKIKPTKPLTKAEQKALQQLFMRAPEAIQRSLNMSTMSTQELLDMLNKDKDVIITCHATDHKRDMESAMLGNHNSVPISPVEATLYERGTRYGDFTHHAGIAQDLQDLMRSHGWGNLNQVQRQALTVIADKIARILSGDPNYADNWHDIQGYAKLVEDRLTCNQNT